MLDNYEAKKHTCDCSDKYDTIHNKIIVRVLSSVVIPYIAYHKNMTLNRSHVPIASHAVARTIAGRVVFKNPLIAVLMKILHRCF